jgi:hypothetical protein
VFRWTPSEAQGPGVYSVTVRVIDGIASTERSFTVTVNEVNAAPVLPTIGTQSLDEGRTFTLNTAATDPDLPANTLSYTLTAKPDGMTIDAVTGVLSWNPTANQAGTNTAIVRVTDDGTPLLSDEDSFQIVVKRAPSQPPTLAVRTEADGIVISFLTQPGRLYQLQTRVYLTEGEWRDEGIPQTGNGGLVIFRMPVVGSSLYLRIGVR